MFSCRATILYIPVITFAPELFFKLELETGKNADCVCMHIGHHVMFNKSCCYSRMKL